MSPLKFTMISVVLIGDSIMLLGLPLDGGENGLVICCLHSTKTDCGLRLAYTFLVRNDAIRLISKIFNLRGLSRKYSICLDFSAFDSFFVIQWMDTFEVVLIWLSNTLESMFQPFKGVVISKHKQCYISDFWKGNFSDYCSFYLKKKFE